MSLSPLFKPQSVAIIGISRKIPSLGHMILNNLLASNYSGSIYLVNPKADRIAGYEVYNEIASLPSVDLAVILTPPKFVPTTIQQLGNAGCQFVSIISAGFDEELTESIIETAKAANISIIGPNSMGTYGPSAHVSFSPIPIQQGSIGFISQSGSIIAVAQECMVGNTGFSAFISLGNKIDITELDALRFLTADPNTSVIAMYLESFSNPSAIRDNLYQATRIKPVILVKGGRTEQGSQAVSSHTGALAGNYRLTQTLLDDCGVMVVNTIEEEINLARFIAKFGISSHSGIVTISSAGGPGVLAADEIVEAGLNLAKLQPQTVQQLQKVIPSFGNAENPLDLVADAGIDRYVDTIKIVTKDPAVTTLLVIIVHPVLIDTEPLLDALDQLNTPIICAYLGPEFASFDQYDNLIVYQTTREVIDILTKINTYHQWQSGLASHSNRSHINEISSTSPLQKNSHVIDLLKDHGFFYPPSLTTSSFHEAASFFSNHTSIVMKLDHPQFSHKTDSGGVILNISTESAFNHSWQSLQTIYSKTDIPDLERKIELQPFYTAGLELVLGCIKDPQFGHFILIGEGGTLVELRDDTVFLPSPTSRSAVHKALKSLTFYKQLLGYRGGVSVDIDILIDYILRFDQLLVDHPEIKELDINPLYIVPKSGEFVVLDARLELVE